MNDLVTVTLLAGSFTSANLLISGRQARKAAGVLATAQKVISDQVAEAARLLVERQDAATAKADAVAAKAEEAAALLLAANERVAAGTDQANGTLTAVHRSVGDTNGESLASTASTIRDLLARLIEMDEYNHEQRHEVRNALAPVTASVPMILERLDKLVAKP